MNANNMNAQSTTFKVTYILLYVMVALFFTFSFSDLITIWTYVIRDNFCPCFMNRVALIITFNFIQVGMAWGYILIPALII